MKQPFLCFLLAIVFLFTQACSAQSQVEPTPTAVQTPDATPVTLPSEDEMEALFWKNCSLSSILTDYQQIMQSQQSEGYQAILDAREALESLCKRVNEQLESATQETFAQLRDAYPTMNITSSNLNEINITWQYLSAMLRSVSDEAQFQKMFDFTCSIVPSDPSSWQVAMQVQPMPFQQALLEMAQDEGSIYLSPRFAYAYLLTVYDDLGEIKPYEDPELPEALVASIQRPLSSTKLRNGWYADRDKGTRRHTGMDMRANADTPIYSCTDGTVLYYGFSQGTGNYVIVMDDLGYEFHYYHMIRESSFLEQGQRVAAGDVIGHVGNTGNSDANHLHLTIITPEDKYMNPYPLMRIAYGQA